MSKIFILGLDGATFDLISPFIEQGHLPNLKKIMEKGMSGTLKSILPFASIPAWPSFYSGMNPGKLGFYYHMKDIVGQYEKEIVQINTKISIWGEFSKYKKTVGVFNVPGTYPPKPVNGFMVSEPIFSKGAEYVWPKELKNIMNNDFNKGDFQNFMGASDKARSDLIWEKMEEIKKFTNIFYDKYSPDFFISVYDVLDVMQHFFWNFYDKTHPDYKQNQFNNNILDCYKFIDNHIGEILRKIDKDTIFIIMSDHGFEKSEKNVFLNQWLLQKGLVKIKGNKLIGKANNKLNLIRDILTKIAIKTGLHKVIPRRVKELAKVSFMDVDWDTSICVAGFFGSIFLNRKNNSINFVESYDKIREEIKMELYELKDLENSRSIVSKVYFKEEIFSGEFMDAMPDLLVVPNKGYVIINGNFKANICEKSELSGMHARDGIFMAVGQGIRKGVFKEANLLDIAPTLLHMFNVPIPAEMDGKVMSFIFEENSPFSRPPQYLSPNVQSLNDAIEGIEL